MGVDDQGNPTAAIGAGIHPFRDPTLFDEFGTTRLAVDVAQFHTYTAEWQRGRATFSVDNVSIRTVNQAPDYPLQMMVAVFDFPSKPAVLGVPAVVPELVVD